MRPAEIEVKISLARREMEYWQGVLRDKGCKNCTHYAMPECVKFNSAPPPDIVQSGCEEWGWDSIPF